MRHIIELTEGEEVKIIRRKHWWVFLTEAVGVIVIALVPFGALLFLAGFAPHIIDLLFGIEYWAITIFLLSAWSLLMWFIFSFAFADYYLDVIAITNSRVIDIEQKGAFSRDIAIVPLAKIQDIKIDISGFFATILGFGDIYIQTAGVTKEVAIKGVSDPIKIKEEIYRLIHQDHTETPSIQEFL